MLRIGNLIGGAANAVAAFGVLVALSQLSAAAPAPKSTEVFLDPAQPNPVTIANEPTQHPFQQSNNGSCFHSVTCNVTLPDVPAGTRRVVNHVSCNAELPDTVTIRPFAEFNAVDFVDYLSIAVTHVGTQSIGIINQMTLVNFDATNPPRISSPFQQLI